MFIVLVPTTEPFEIACTSTLPVVPFDVKTPFSIVPKESSDNAHVTSAGISIEYPCVSIASAPNSYEVFGAK